VPVVAVGIGAVVGAIAQGVTTAMTGGSAGDIGSAMYGGALLGASMTASAMTGEREDLFLEQEWVLASMQ